MIPQIIPWTTLPGRAANRFNGLRDKKYAVNSIDPYPFFYDHIIKEPFAAFFHL